MGAEGVLCSSPCLIAMLDTQLSPSEATIAAARWRLLTGYELSGPYNMAVDEALLESVIRGDPPAIRFYTWNPATLSLGVNQPIGEVDAEACAARGFGLVRRLTGGRAVLHQHELTYSLVARESDPRVSGGVIESYRKISNALVAGLRSIGANAELAPPSRAMFRAMASARRASGIIDEAGDSEGVHGAVCFDAASAYELTANGRKLVGSAQARRGGALLQHGSILLDIDWDGVVSVFAYASEAGKQRAYEKLPTRMTSLRAELGRVVTPHEVAAALEASFASTLNLDLEPGGLSPEEEGQAISLAAGKYATEAWTRKM